MPAENSRSPLFKSVGSASTRLMCDLMRFQSGGMTMDDIRKNWAKGEYKGAPEAWALAAIDHAKRHKK
jgi:hypothetical protein